MQRSASMLRRVALLVLAAALPAPRSRADVVSLSMRAGAPRPAEPSGTWSERDRKSGSAGALRGTICLAQLFVSAPDFAWTERDEDAALRAVAAATDYLTTQARTHGVTLRWLGDRADLYLPAPLPHDLDDHRWTETAIAAAWGARGPCAGRNAASVVVVLHTAAVGRSYALPYPFYWDERVVMLRRPLVGPYERAGGARPASLVETPAAYAHELLHAFGAEDLYRPAARRAAARRRYPADIMLDSHRPLAELQIGAYTGYAVGWLDVKPATL